MENTFAVPVPVPLDNNYCQAVGGGQGWSWSVIDNLDVTGDTLLEYRLDFFHYMVGHLYARINHALSKYDYTKVVLFGAGLFNNKPVTVKAEVSSEGGFYGRGQTIFYIYADTNLNGIWESGEPLLRTLRLPATYTKIYLEATTN